MSFTDSEMVKIDEAWDFLMLPRQVVLVTALDHEGKPNIITIAWATPVSHNPLIVAIAVSPKRYSYGLIDNAREFVVNIPDISMAEYTNWCGRKTGRKYDKWQESGWTAEPGISIKTHHIKEVYCFMECKVTQQVVAGDHTTFFGQVSAAYAAKDTFKKVKKGGPPALYFDPANVKGIHHLGGDMYVTTEDKYVEFEVGGVIDV